MDKCTGAWCETFTISQQVSQKRVGSPSKGITSLFWKSWKQKVTGKIQRPMLVASDPHNTHMTLLTNLSYSKPVTSPVTPPALVPPWNSSALEALLSQLQHQLQDSQNWIPHLNFRYHQYCPQYFFLKLVPVPVPVPNLVPVPISVFQHSIPVSPLLYTSLSCVPIHILLCSCS